jgi:hypothetical protein
MCDAIHAYYGGQDNVEEMIRKKKMEREIEKAIKDM